MELWWYLGGWVRLRLTSADCLARLRDISGALALEDVVWRSELTAEFRVRRGELGKVLVRDGETLEILGNHGLPALARRLGRWKTFAASLLLFGLLTAWLPGRILFLSVSGNEEIPARLILEAAADAGVYFGASRREIQSEQVKNHLLYAIPELRWAGVNTTGCMAVITVRPRSAQEQLADDLPGNIVAVRDAVITEVFPQTGTVQVRRGQAVREGEVLISGMAELGLLTRTDRASGEVYGLSRREVSAKLPTETTFRQETGVVRRVRSLILGKKRIYFSNDSGILHSTCVKMIFVKNLTLPGGFELPVRLVTESYYLCDTGQAAREDPEATLRTAVRSYALEQMIAGEILAEDWTWREGALHGILECREMIGRFRPENDLKGETNDDREIGERGAG